MSSSGLAGAAWPGLAPAGADAADVAGETEIVPTFLTQHYLERPVPPTIVVPDDAALDAAAAIEGAELTEIQAYLLRILGPILIVPRPALGFDDTIDHLCCFRRCINPDHWTEPVTRAENTSLMQQRKRNV